MRQAGRFEMRQAGWPNRPPLPRRVTQHFIFSVPGLDLSWFHFRAYFLMLTHFFRKFSLESMYGSLRGGSNQRQVSSWELEGGRQAGLPNRPPPQKGDTNLIKNPDIINAIRSRWYLEVSIQWEYLNSKPQTPNRKPLI